ncbi:MAG: zf-HC2 domain-containing protein [Acidimicrobiales bacterium]
MTWHADSPLLTSYVEGDIDDAQAFSLEAHLLECARCRAGLTACVARTPSSACVARTPSSACVDPDRVAASWHRLDAAIDAPRPGPIESLLRRMGVREHLARLLAATPALRVSWLAAVAVTLAFAVAAAYGDHGDRAKLVFLLVAPLLPMAGVAAAYWPGADPASELSLIAPYGGFRLLLVRTVAVMGATIGLAAVASLALPGLDTTDAAWIVPALALSAASLALATFTRPGIAVSLVATTWVAGVLATEIAGAGGLQAFLRAGPIESGIFDPGGQLALLALTFVAVAVIAMRRDTFDMGRTA